MSSHGSPVHTCRDIISLDQSGGLPFTEQSSLHPASSSRNQLICEYDVFQDLVGCSYLFHFASCCSLCVQSERFQLISGNSSIYSLTVRRVIKRWEHRWGNGGVIERNVWRAHSAAASWDDGGKRRINKLGGRCRLPSSSSVGSVEELWLHVVLSEKNQGAAVSCRSALWNLSSGLRGKCEGAQCCTAEPQGERTGRTRKKPVIPTSWEC